jgi:predicted acylesterase/phospholipase RssA
MGITILQKSDLNRPKTNPKVAIVLAGGAVSGGAFKVGGLQALDHCLVNRKVTDFDTFIGLSAGSIISSFLANGIPPKEMLSSLEGESSLLDSIHFSDFYYPNLEDFIKRPFIYLWDVVNFIPDFMIESFLSTSILKKDVRKALRDLLLRPSYRSLEKLVRHYTKALGGSRRFPSPLNYLPRGLFANDRIEASVRKTMIRNQLPNDFIELYRRSGKELFIVAGNLDTADRVVFGYNQNNNLTISQAIQASTALPGFFRPARIQGVDYIDGGVRKTANLDVAVESGADLIICYNPFRPFHNRVVTRYSKEKRKQVTEGKYIGDEGLISVLNQVFRILLHSRLTYGMDIYRRDPRFRGDIILIEPTEYDYRFFDMNPLAFWERNRAARRGFDSTTESIDKKYHQVKRILNAYGIQIRKPAGGEPFEEADAEPPSNVLPFTKERTRKIRQAAS